MKSQRLSVWLLPVSAFFYPVIFLIDFVTGAKTIENDFWVLYYKYKVYLLSALSTGKFPLWSPSEAGGFPFYSDPFAQAYYPLNIPLAVFYKLTNGYSYLDHQIFTVLGVSIFCLGLYLWLNSLNYSRIISLFSAISISMSLKVTEILRFPNAVHTMAWMPFILLGCTLIFKNKQLKLGIYITSLSSLMLLTAGYPYFIYYSIFLIPPYLIYLKLSKKYIISIRTAVFLVVAFAIPLLICSPYLFKVQQLLNQTTDRGGNSYSYSTAHVFGFTDTVGSLVFPPAAQAEGWYYFGIANLILIVLTVINQKLIKQKTNLFLIGWTVIISYITYGKNSYLFDLLWKYLPGFGGLRVWGRLNIILVPILALLLAKAAASLKTMIKNVRKIDFLYVILISLIIIMIQTYLYKGKIFNDYWTKYFENQTVFINESSYIFHSLWSGLFLLIALITAKFFPSRKYLFPFLLVTLMIISYLDLKSLSLNQWVSNQHADLAKISINIGRIDLASFTTKRSFTYDTISLSDQFNVGSIENWYFRGYISLLQRNQVDIHRPLNHPEIAELLGVSKPKKIFFSPRIDYQEVRTFLNDSIKYETASNFTYQINRYTGDQLELVVKTDQEGFLSFIDNWDPDWSALDDSKPVLIEKLFGTFKSIKIRQPGTSSIVFNYQPKLFN